LADHLAFARIDPTQRCSLMLASVQTASDHPTGLTQLAM
jgi:hypothetical protein